jgi:hypothetical protein
MKKVMVLTGAFLMIAAAGFSQERTEKKELKKVEATEQKVEVKEATPKQNIQLQKAEAKPVRAARPVAAPASEIKTEEVKRKEEE